MRALKLLSKLESARMTCVTVAEQTGGLLEDDPAVADLIDAERQLELFDRGNHWSRARTEGYKAPRFGHGLKANGRAS